jgi:hypothetical protein
MIRIKYFVLIYGDFLLVESKIHTTKADFEETVRLAAQAGFTLYGNPKIFLSR